MTCLDIPSNVLVKRGPPEAVCESTSSRIESVVAKLVMCFLKDAHTF